MRYAVDQVNAKGGGQTPELTNELCHFHHFRFDIRADQKVDALIRQVAA